MRYEEGTERITHLVDPADGVDLGIGVGQALESHVLALAHAVAPASALQLIALARGGLPLALSSPTGQVKSHGWSIWSEGERVETHKSLIADNKARTGLK